MPGNKPVLVVVGTRPEGIKMIPVYYALKEAGIPVMLCSTDQHTDLLQEVFDVFDVQPDVHLRIGKAGQDLFHITYVSLWFRDQVFLNKRTCLMIFKFWS